MHMFVITCIRSRECDCVCVIAYGHVCAHMRPYELYVCVVTLSACGLHKGFSAIVPSVPRTPELPSDRHSAGQRGPQMGPVTARREATHAPGKDPATHTGLTSSSSFLPKSS